MQISSVSPQYKHFIQPKQSIKSPLPAPIAACTPTKPEVKLTAKTETFLLDHPIKKDRRVHIRTLSNGLTVYTARHLSKVPNEVTCSLVVKVGQRDDGPELAHFAEHVVMEDTPSFPNGSLDEEMRKLGCVTAKDANAYTADNHTQYIYKFPAKTEESIEKVLLGLSEIAAQATFKDSDIERERKLIFDEINLRDSQGLKNYCQQRKAIYHDSRLGQVDRQKRIEALRNYSPDDLRNFYKKWYTPDRMAIVVAGDIDEKKVNEMIDSYFSPIAKKTSPLPDKDTHFSPIPGIRILPIEQENDTGKVEIHYIQQPIQSCFKDPLCSKLDVDTIFMGIIKKAALQMITKRLASPAYAAENTPYMGTGIGVENMGHPFLKLSVVAWGNDYKTAVKRAVEEVQRCQQHGFSEDETEESKNIILKEIRQEMNNVFSDGPSSLAQNCAEHFSEDSPLADPLVFLKLAKALVPKITGELCQFWLQEAINTPATLISVFHGKNVRPNYKSISQGFVQGQNSQLKKLQNPPLSTHLPAIQAERGRILSREEHPQTKSVSYLLSNGMKVTWKVVREDLNQVFITSSADVGTHNLAKKERIHAKAAQLLAYRSGLGPLSHEQTENLSIEGIWKPSIGSYNTAFAASAPAQDLEKMLKIQHLAFAEQDFNPNVLQDVKKRLHYYLKILESSAKGKLSRQVTNLTYKNPEEMLPLTTKDLSSLSFEKTKAFHDAIWKDPSLFHTVITGAVKEEELIPLIEKYLASIPKQESPFQKSIHPDLSFSTGIQRSYVFSEKDQTLTILSLPTIQDYSQPKMAQRRDWVAEILQDRIHQTIRTQMGESYGCDVLYAEPYHRSQKNAVTRITFSSNFETIDSIEKAILSTIEEFKTTGPTEKEMHNLRASLERKTLQDEATSVGWNSILQERSSEVNGLDFHEEFKEDFRTITAEEIRETAQYLDTSSFIRVTLTHESKKQQVQEMVEKAKKIAKKNL